MQKGQSLADFLGVPNIGAPRDTPVEEVGPLTAKEFCEKVLNSREFRSYILNGIALGDLPAQVIIRLMDIGWGKPVERLEHTGKDGLPIETVTEIRRVMVRAQDAFELDDEPRGHPTKLH